MRRKYALAAILAMLVSALGCAGGPEEIPEEAYPTLTGLTTADGKPLDSAAVGDMIEFEGTRFVPSGLGWVDVTFRGEYDLEDGTRQQVDLTVPLQADSNGRIRWSFGGYRIPFTEGGNQLGTFRGHVYATNRFFDADYKPQQRAETWPLVTLTVKPSLIVQDFRAMGPTWVASSCKWPAPNVINSVPYALRVRAVGFQPQRYDFLMSRGLIVEGQAMGGEHTVTKMSSETEYAVLVRYADVPEHSTGYRGSVHTTAYGTDGVEYKVLYPFIVRRPVQAFITSGRVTAQRYVPREQVSCINGSAFPVTTSYAESNTETETRGIQRSVERSWDRSQTQSFGETRGSSESVGEANGYSDTVTIALTESEGASEADTIAFASSSGVDDATSLSFTNMTSETDSQENGQSSSGSSTTGSSSSSGSTSGQTASSSAQNTVGWFVTDEEGNSYSYNTQGQLTGGTADDTEVGAGLPGNIVRVEVEGQVTRGYANGGGESADTHSLRATNQNGSSTTGGENGASYSESQGRENNQSSTTTAGQNQSQGHSSTSGDSASRERGVTFKTSNEESRSRQEGRSWERAQTYSEAVGVTNTSTWEYTGTYSQSVDESQSIGESIGESESELLQTSSSKTTELGVSGQIWAGAFGTWYRQKTRFVQFVSYVEYDLCGNGHERAQTEMDDYTWAVGLSVGPECSPAPELPDAGCLIEREFCEDDEGAADQY